MKKFLLIIVCFWLVSCNSSDNDDKGRKIAEVGTHILWESDVKGIFLPNITKEDSLHLLNTFVNNWARKQLLASLAEQQLSEDQKNVSQELDDYRLSLLIFRYEKVYMEQRLNIEVSEEEIEKFYKDYPENFVAVTPVVKALYIKIKKDLPELKHITKLFRLKDPKNVMQLAVLCEGTAERFTDFNEAWIDFNYLLQELPNGKYEAVLSQHYLETADDKYVYLVYLYDVVMPGATAPLVYEKENIRSIILNKRRQEIIKSLENSVYNEGLNHNKVKIYIDKE